MVDEAYAQSKALFESDQELYGNRGKNGTTMAACVDVVYAMCMNVELTQQYIG